METGIDGPIITRILCDEIPEGSAHVGADELLTTLYDSRDRIRHFRALVTNMLRPTTTGLVLPARDGMGIQRSSSSAMPMAPTG